MKKLLQQITYGLAAFSLLLSSSTSMANDAFSQIKNINQASQYIYTAGQPSIEALKTLKAQGIKTVINLRPIAEFDDTQEKAILASQGINYINIGVAGVKGLTEKNVKALDNALSSLPKGERILLHCASSNRVGAMMALRANWFGKKDKYEALAIGNEHGLGSLEKTVKEKLK